MHISDPAALSLPSAAVPFMRCTQFIHSIHSCVAFMLHLFIRCIHASLFIRYICMPFYIPARLHSFQRYILSFLPYISQASLIHARHPVFPGLIGGLHSARPRVMRQKAVAIGWLGLILIMARTFLWLGWLMSI